jgi:hypothetical protein
LWEFRLCVSGGVVPEFTNPRGANAAFFASYNAEIKKLSAL